MYKAQIVEAHNKIKIIKINKNWKPKTKSYI